MLFTGEFSRSVDDKGRLIVPSNVRDLIGTEDVVLTPGVEPCIDFWPHAAWETRAGELMAQRQSAVETRRTLRQLAAKSHTDRVDKQGRITLPPALREFAGIDAEAVVVGALSHVEIWSPENYRLELEKQEETPLAQRFEQLSI